MNPQWVHEVFACVVINDFQMIFTGNIKVLTPVQIEALELEKTPVFYLMAYAKRSAVLPINCNDHTVWCILSILLFNDNNKIKANIPTERFACRLIWPVLNMAYNMIYTDEEKFTNTVIYMHPHQLKACSDRKHPLIFL